VKINHYSLFTKLIGTSVTVGLLTLCFINPGWILIALFFLPFLIIFSLWTFFDSTYATLNDEIITIKIRNRLFTDKYKFHKKNVLKLKIIQQGFINKADKLRGSDYITNPQAAFMISQSDTKAYTKAMIAIQTNKRVIRFGKPFTDKEIKVMVEHLKNIIK